MDRCTVGQNFSRFFEKIGKIWKKFGKIWKIEKFGKWKILEKWKKVDKIGKRWTKLEKNGKKWKNEIFFSDLK